MKKAQLVLAFIFIAFIIVMFVKQSKSDSKLFKDFVYGQVVSTEKANKGFYHLTIIQNKKLKVLSYIPGVRELMASRVILCIRI